jgi:hypothetical protein
MADKNKGGRPLKFECVSDLENKINEYFKMADKKGKPYSIAALAVFLDCSRETIYEYERNPEKQEGFSDTIKKARDKCIAQLEEKLLDGKQNVTGAIFIAKNYGYTDKQEVDMKSDNTNTNYNYDLDAKKFMQNATKDELQKYESGLMTDREIAEIIGRG